MTSKRILLADDHAIVRAGLKSIIKEMYPFAAFDEAANGDQVMDLVRKHSYDLIILDINMPKTDSIKLVGELFGLRESSKVLIFSINSEMLYAKRFFKLGVLGYMDKECGPGEIRKAVESVMEGVQYMSDNLKQFLFDDMLHGEGGNPFEKLSNREIQIAKYLLQGYSQSEIKKTLKLHSSTIGTHKARFFDKLKISSIFELRELANLYSMDSSGGEGLR